MGSLPSSPTDTSECLHHSEVTLSSHWVQLCSLAEGAKWPGLAGGHSGGGLETPVGSPGPGNNLHNIPGNNPHNRHNPWHPDPPTGPQQVKLQPQPLLITRSHP